VRKRSRERMQQALTAEQWQKLEQMMKQGRDRRRRQRADSPQ
jgi:hypothetical protein